MIAREGYRLIGIAAAITLISWWLHPVLFVACAGLTVFIVAFFRSPRRVIPAGDGLIVAPADGRIVFAGPVGGNPYGLVDRKRVSIFMSPADVHVNRVPVSGTVTDVLYNRGRYFAAFTDKASFANEQMAHFVRTDGGDEIVFVQIAGWFARRIVSSLRRGEKIVQGKLFGMIKFGSRMDVYLPMHYELMVRVGEKTRGGASVIARNHP